MRFLLATAALALATPAFAQDKDAPPVKIEAQSVEKRMSGVFGGQRVDFTVTMADTLLGDEEAPGAVVVTTAYVKQPRDPSRPVTFLFNGGPGSGSLWLQMGAFGPKRVAIPSDARDDGAPPYPILDNPDSLLDVTDLVFIDPPGTGFSYVTENGKGEEYYGVTQDAKAVAQTIRHWVDANGRWNSPKFIGGESYGTTRSAAVVRELEGAYSDLAFNGVILISAILDFAFDREVQGNELPFINALPSMAAAAWYHGKTDAPALEPFVAEARAFALGPYATALLKGQNIGADEYARTRAGLARYTGLSETYLDRANLRVELGRFYKELLRDRGLTIGRLDARYTGRDYDNAGETPDADPSFYGIDAGYTAAINAFTRETLGYDTRRVYQSIGFEPNAAWDWRIPGGNAYFNVTPWLARAMRENSGMGVFVGQGYYDFATPFLGAEYSLSRYGVPQDRVEFEYYEAGHMMYARDEDRVKLSADVRDFIRRYQ